MPRLIDSDKLMVWFDNYYDSDEFSVGYISGIIREQPTIDAVEVVRCRDCEWYKTNYSWDGKERKVCGIEPFEPIRQEEDYCSFGERSD